MKCREEKEETNSRPYVTTIALPALDEGEVLGFRTRLFIDNILTLQGSRQAPMALKRQVRLLR